MSTDALLNVNHFSFKRLRHALSMKCKAFGAVRSCLVVTTPAGLGRLEPINIAVYGAKLRINLPRPPSEVRHIHLVMFRNDQLGLWKGYLGTMYAVESKTM